MTLLENKKAGNLITLPNIDGKIWDVERSVVDIINELDNNGKVTISLNHEGPCAESLKLYDLLDDICEKGNFLKSSITILTNNVLEKHSEYTLVISGPLYLNTVKTFIKSHKFPEKDFDNLKHFGLFIGRSNWLRLWVTSEVFCNFKDISLITFHYNTDVDFHREHLGVDDLLRNLGKSANLESVTKLVEQCPVVLEQSLPLYPIVTPSHFEIAKVYHNFFVEIICETYCQGTTFYPTEKLWRPIALKTPFIVQGPKNYYHNLHKMGFKTFSNWWDEGFTNDDYNYQPMEIFRILHQLASLSVTELEGLYIDMQTTLDHNYQRLMSLTPTDFVRAFNE